MSRFAKNVEFTLARHHGNSGLFSVLEIYVYLLFYFYYLHVLFDIHFDLAVVLFIIVEGGVFSLNSRGGSFFTRKPFYW